MSVLSYLLVASLVTSGAYSLVVQHHCDEYETSSLCGGDISASLKVTLTEEPVVAVQVPKRWSHLQENTTTPTIGSTATPNISGVSEATTAAALDPEGILDEYATAINYDDEDFEDFFNPAEKNAEEKERERLAAERKEYEKMYCADQEGDREITNLENTGFNVPPNYEVFPGVGIYRFHRLPLSWEEARRRCESEGAHLLVLNSDEEWSVVDSLMDRCPRLLDTHFNYYSYIGVHDMRHEGRFETVVGGLLDDTGYVKWMAHQPDNAHVEGENCLTVSRDGEFNDVPCNTSLPYVCEHASF